MPLGAMAIPLPPSGFYTPLMFGSVHGVTVLRKPSEDCEAVSPCAILRFKSIAILGLVIALALALGVGRECAPYWRRGKLLGIG